MFKNKTKSKSVSTSIFCKRKLKQTNKQYNTIKENVYYENVLNIYTRTTFTGILRDAMECCIMGNVVFCREVLHSSSKFG